MQLGSSRDVGQINYDLIALSNATRDLFTDWATFGKALEDLGAENLVGPEQFTQEEVELLTRIVVDTRLLTRIFKGEVALQNAQDFTFNLRRVWGMRRTQ